MKVVTPQLKLNVRIEQASMKDSELSMNGIAGMLPCDVTLDTVEIWHLIRILPKIALLNALIRNALRKKGAS